MFNVAFRYKRSFSIQRFSESAGFSLVELLAVVAIIGIMTGLGVTIGPGILKSSAMSGGLSQVASALSLARSEAIRSRKPTFFVLAPTSALDEKSYIAYSILQSDSLIGTNYTYLRRWEKLPQSVLFNPQQMTGNNQLPTKSLPYPTDASNAQQMFCICFQSDGGLDEDTHAIGTSPRLPLQTGVRISPTDPPSFQGNYTTNEITVQRVTGKVGVERLAIK
jgi:prepilin-type N-terminal cleavage/methylation domain-containing protein